SGPTRQPHLHYQRLGRLRRRMPAAPVQHQPPLRCDSPAHQRPAGTTITAPGPVPADRWPAPAAAGYRLSKRPANLPAGLSAAVAATAGTIAATADSVAGALHRRP